MGALELDVEPATVEVAGRADAVLEPRLLLALLERVRTARPELAALRQIDERRRRPLDRVQALDPRPVETRDRSEEAPRVRHLRVVEDVPLRATLDDAAGVHDDDLVGHAAAVCAAIRSAGFSEVIGSWRLMPASLPRWFCVSRSETVSRSLPL